MRAMRPKLKHMIETFIPILPTTTKSDSPPVADPAWLAARGIEQESPWLLVTLRDRVAPLITIMKRVFDLEWFTFLVHAYPLVPTNPKDKNAYIHLRLSFTRKSDANAALVRLREDGVVAMTREFKLPKKVAGVAPSAFIDGDATTAWRIMGEQSAWLLSFITRHKKTDDALQLVMHTRQFLHFLANATQMRVA